MAWSCLKHGLSATRVWIAITLSGAGLLAQVGLVAALEPLEDRSLQTPQSHGRQLLPYLAGGDVWLVDLEEGGAWPVTEGGSAWQPSLSADGSRLAYWTKAADTAGVAELWRVELATGRKKLLSSSHGALSELVWSPKGDRLAWSEANRLFVSDLQGVSETLASFESPGLVPPALSWSSDGSSLLLAVTREGRHGLWAVTLHGGAWRLIAPWSPGDMAAWAPGVNDSWEVCAAGAVQRLGSDGCRLGAVALSPEPQGTVSQIARSRDDASLAFVTRDGSVLLADSRTGAARGVSGLSDRIARVAWLTDGRLVCWSAQDSTRTQSVWQVDRAEGSAQALVARPALPANTLLTASPLRPRPAAERPYDWYRYQGEWDSGPMASNNCGPTSVAMAIQFALDNLWVPISTIREYIGGSGWTYPDLLQSALDHWGAPNRRLYSMAEIHDAVATRDSIVLVHLWMYWFTPGSDYLHAYSDSTDHYGRYYSFDQSHWVVLKGLSEDGQWAVCHDPNVWDGYGTYWYAGGVPKGKDRYYRYSELVGSIAAYNYQAIEVYTTSPATATPTLTATERPTPTSTQTASPTPTTTASATATSTLDPERTVPAPSETPTLSIEPTSTHTPSPTITRAPTARPELELLQNGGFETEGAWTFPLTPARARRSEDVSQEGSWSALLGLTPEQSDVYSYSTVHQRVLVPADAEQLQLSFWYWAHTQEVVSVANQAVSWAGYAPLRALLSEEQSAAASIALWSTYDWQRAMILDADYRVEEILWSSCENAVGWQRFSTDLEGYAGQEIVLLFEVLNNGAGDRRTWMNVDNVSMAVPGDWLLALPLILR